MVIAPEKNSPSIPFKRFPPSLHTGKANDSVGPNYYDPSKELIQKHERVIDFSKAECK